MNKRVKIFNVIYILSFYAILFCILFLKWYSNKSPDKFIALVTLILLVVDIGTNYSVYKCNKKTLFLNFSFLILLIIYSLLNIAFTDINSYAFEYLIDFTLYPILTLIFVNKADSLENEKLKKYILIPSFWLLNIYNFVNFFIILKQIENPIFMVRNFTTNTFYKDMLNGLIGVNGASKLSFLYLICLYLSYLNFKSPKKYLRFFSKFFFVFVLISSIYVSLYNDNRTYYFLLVMFMFPLIWNKKKKMNINKLMKGSALILILSALFGIAYKTNGNFSELVDEIVRANLTRTFANFNRSSNGEAGGEERIELLKYALNDGNGYSFGLGIGILKPTAEGDVVVPNHFGLNDSNVRILSGGLIFLIMIIVIYTNFIYQRLKQKNKFMYMFIFVTLAFISLYTQVFSYCEKTFLVVFAYFLLINIENEKNKEIGDIK